MPDNISFKSIRLVSFKGFPDHTINLRRSNVLVGANNAGKSTALGALRLIVAMLPQAQRINPNSVGRLQDQMLRGWGITRAALDNAGFSMENLRHDFRPNETRIEVKTTAGARLVAAWPAITDDDEPAPYGVFFVFPPDGDGRRPMQAARDLTPTVAMLPTLTPLDDRETSVSEETLRRHSSGRHSSRYFRNRLAQLAESDWIDFTSYVYERTPEIANLTIRRDYSSDESDFDLFYAEPETGHEREMGWSGDGMQIWIQILFHLWHQESADVVLLDEPDVFLHPDLQRRLARTLFDGSSQIIVATHSVEILAESEPGSVVWVDRSRRHSQRPKPDGSLSQIGRRLGSGFELGIGRALRSSAVLFVEGDDAPILAHLARRVGELDVASASTYATVPLGGFSKNWRAAAFAETMTALGTSVSTFVILDSDLRSLEELDRDLAGLRGAGASVHVWKRREIENYLLEPQAIAAASGADLVSARALLDEQLTTHRDEAFVTLQTQRLSERGGISERTTLRNAHDEFDERWTQTDGPVGLVDAKSVIRGLNSALQRGGLQTVNAFKLAQRIRRDNVADEMKTVLADLASFIRTANA